MKNLTQATKPVAPVGLLEVTFKEVSERGFVFSHTAEYEGKPKTTEITMMVNISSDTKVAQSGKPQYVNSVGKFTYADSPEDIPEWFSQVGLRLAFEGESETIALLAALGRINVNELDPNESEFGVDPSFFSGNTEALSTAIKDMSRVLGVDVSSNLVRIPVFVKVSDSGKMYVNVVRVYDPITNPEKGLTSKQRDNYAAVLARLDQEGNHVSLDGSLKWVELIPTATLSQEVTEEDESEVDSMFD